MENETIVQMLTQILEKVENLSTEIVEVKRDVHKLNVQMEKLEEKTSIQMKKLEEKTNIQMKKIEENINMINMINIQIADLESKITSLTEFTIRIDKRTIEMKGQLTRMEKEQQVQKINITALIGN